MSTHESIMSHQLLCHCALIYDKIQHTCNYKFTVRWRLLIGPVYIINHASTVGKSLLGAVLNHAGTPKQASAHGSDSVYTCN